MKTEAGDEISADMMRLARAIYAMLHSEAPERYWIPVLDTVIGMIDEGRIDEPLTDPPPVRPQGH